MNDEEQELQAYFDSLLERWQTLCQERYAEGAKRYGQLTFLENDVVRMMLEELADTANYCQMQAVKLMILQERLEAGMQQEGLVAGDKLGFEAFKGTKDVGWH
jgi:hypothetical protein